MYNINNYYGSIPGLAPVALYCIAAFNLTLCGASSTANVFVRFSNAAFEKPVRVKIYHISVDYRI